MSYFDQTLSQIQLSQLKSPQKRWIGGLEGASAALLLAEISHKISQPIVYISKNQHQLIQLENELRFFAADVHVFPDWEILPYDRLSPHQDIISERLALLFNMPKQGIILVAASTLQQKIAPPAWLLGEHFNLKKGQSFDLEQQRQQLIATGYHVVETVYAHGEFAVRGSLMDIFASGQDKPIRIELFDDEIESLRFFDPETQRTTETLDQFVILPAKEFPLSQAKSTFQQRYAELFPRAEPKKNPLYQDVLNGIAATGIEFYLPLFFSAEQMQSGHFFSYLAEKSIVIYDAALGDVWQKNQVEANKRYQDRSHDIDRPILAPDQWLLETHEINQHLNQFARIVLSDAAVAERQGAINVAATTPPKLEVDSKSSQPFAKLHTFIAQNSPVLLVAQSPGRRQRLIEQLQLDEKDLITVSNFKQFSDLEIKLGIMDAPIERGLVLKDQFSLVVENQLFEHSVVSQSRRHRKQQTNEELLIRSLTEISIDSPVVHLDHGVGRYAGLVLLEVEGQTHEFLQLNYADDAKIYVPVANLHLISRYSGGDHNLAPLHKIGTDQWNKAKRKVLEQIRDVAAELLHVQARREARPGLAFEIDQANYQQFCDGFGYEETIDQANAITSTLHDMALAKPMDRLICGDVGFGKTEVAMRAAFVAAMNQKQVMILVPTTLLAQQHFESFLDRFADWPIRIEVLSRFGSSKKHQQVIDGLASGQVDIVIGTHKLLQKQIVFQDLGLMIVDEEHRFGVRDKEKIKAMRADVDMLTLTATPIPRTLNMAFSGMRDLSIIVTPPARRLAVKTFVQEDQAETIKEAILRELLRGGQVYYLHNEVNSIERKAENLRELLPEARVTVGHGQMRERELEQVMQQFYHKHFNVLVCSTIVETGIDVPNANTIIIERADKLGLAQLHQLRGRVGRSHHQAYAYLLVPSIKHLKGDAAKRLDAIQRASTLGAGFMLASEDLEIRGAGEILGEQQSGSMQAVGYNLYMRMLEKATKAIQRGETPNIDQPFELNSEINLHLPAVIPDSYVSDVHQRLVLYKRISDCDDLEKLQQLRIELIDRYGMPPVQIGYLFHVHRLRLMAKKLGISRIDVAEKQGIIEFLPETKVQAIRIIQLIQSQPNHFSMQGGQRLKLTMSLEQHQIRLDTITDLLQRLIDDL